MSKMMKRLFLAIFTLLFISIGQSEACDTSGECSYNVAQKVYFYVVDTDGTTPETGVSYTAVTIGFTKDDNTTSTIALAADDCATLTDGDWCEIDATNQPGLYYAYEGTTATFNDIGNFTYVYSATGHKTQPYGFAINAEDRLATTDFDTTATVATAAVDEWETQSQAAPTGFHTNVIQVSSDATAANNLELDYDGTGYAKANSTIGTTTTNTDMRGTDNAALASALATAQLDLDTITGAAGALLDTTATSPQLVDDIIDEVLTGGTHNVVDSLGRRIRDLQEFGTYENGAVWIDTVNGSAGTTDYESGTAFNPVDTLADATTIAISLGLTRFELAPNSSITLAQTYNNYLFMGDGWSLALGGQDVAGSHFHGANVSGIGIGATEFEFENCMIGTSTLNQFHAINSGFSGTVTFGAAGDYTIYKGHSMVAGSSTPVFDTGAAIGNVNLTIPDWSNGIEIQNLNNTGTDLFSISGTGQIIYAASSSGVVNQRGDWQVTNTGGVTITADDNTANIVLTLADTADMQPKLGTPAGASISVDIAENQTDLNTIITNIAALNDIAVADIKAMAIEGVYDLGDVLCVMSAVISGKLSTSSGTASFRGLEDTEDRAVIVVVAGGNRTSVTLDLTGCN